MYEIIVLEAPFFVLESVFSHQAYNIVRPFSRLERQPSNPDHKSGMTGKGVSAGRMTDFPDLPILFRAGPNNRSLVAVFDVVVPVMLIAYQSTSL